MPMDGVWIPKEAEHSLFRCFIGFGDEITLASLAADVGEMAVMVHQHGGARFRSCTGGGMQLG